MDGSLPYIIITVDQNYLNEFTSGDNLLTNPYGRVIYVDGLQVPIGYKIRIVIGSVILIPKKAISL